MLNLRFRPENEVKLEYAPRITQVDWDRHANAVKNMHEDRKTRREILKALNHEHDFRPTMAQLSTHMRREKLRVSRKAGDDDGYAVEPTATDLLPVEDEVLEIVNETLPTQQQFMWDADSVSRGKVTPASTSPQTRAVTDNTFMDMLDLLPPKIGEETPSGTHTYWEGAEENKAEVRGRRMSHPGDKNISATFENVENGPDVLVEHGQDRNPSQYPYVASREVSVCSFRSQRSDLSSLRAFREFAADLSRAAQLRRQPSQSSLSSLTIMSEESWNFGQVTGIPSDGLAVCGSGELGAAEWEAYRTKIAELYIGRDLSFQSVQDHMNEHHGFEATKRMYKARISSWGLSKNISRQDWMTIALPLRDQELAGQTQPVYVQIRDRTGIKKDYERFLKHCGVLGVEFLMAAITLLGSAGCDGKERTPYVIVMDEPMEQEGGVDIL